MTKQPLLTIKNLNLKFLTSEGTKTILENIDLTIGRGESVALVGESGSGKSMTALAVMGLFPTVRYQVEGSICFDGEEMFKKTPEQLRLVRGKKIGMIFQDPMTSLNPTLTVGWQIAEVLIYHCQMTRLAAKERAIELLGLVGIADPRLRYDAYPFQLSGGMRQRVMIAMALACEPIMLIADEPTTALDVTVQAQILDLVQTIRRQMNMTLLLITHDLGIVAGVCDRVAVMQHGRIVEMNDVERLYRSPQHPYTRMLLESKFGAFAHAT